MQKIMFNDKFGLTKAVLEGRKTMTRRIVNFDRVPTLIPGRIAECCLKYAPFKVGEVVAIAQAYKEIHEKENISPIEMINRDRYEKSAGWNNKMFVRASLMYHHIRITNVRVERMQDISEEDCLREGIFFYNCGIDCGYTFFGERHRYGTPRNAFAALIAKVSGKGVWDSNPFVFVYEFELVK